MRKKLVLIWSEEQGKLVTIKNTEEFDMTEILDMREDFSTCIELFQEKLTKKDGTMKEWPSSVSQGIMDECVKKLVG